MGHWRHFCSQHTQLTCFSPPRGSRRKLPRRHDSIRATTRELPDCRYTEVIKKRSSRKQSLTRASEGSELASAREGDPVQIGFVLIFSPFRNLSISKQNCNHAVIAIVHLKCVFSISDLFFRVEGKVVPPHLHRRLGLDWSPKEIINRLAAEIDLTIRRFHVDGVFRKAVCLRSNRQLPFS